MPIKVPLRYLPSSLTPKDKRKQAKMLLRSKKNYKNGKYYTRKKIASYPVKPSPHVIRAKKRYDIDSLQPTRALARKTGCSLSALKEIVRKGEGAYFSSGSRPSQTGPSWGLARLASSLTGGKAAAVDFSILKKGCRSDGPAFQYALMARKKYGHGLKSTRRVILK